MPPDTGTGELEGARPPLPNWPTLPCPQQKAFPEELSAQVVWFPPVTDATGDMLAGTVTVIVPVPLTPSDVAVIVTEPADRPLTTPFPSTLATSLFDVAQATLRSVTIFPPFVLTRASN